MARGFLSGLIWGSLASGVGLAGLSVAMDPPVLSERPAIITPDEKPAKSEAAGTPENAMAGSNRSNEAESQETATQAPATQAPAQPAAPEPEVVAKPVPSVSPSAPAAPEVNAEADSLAALDNSDTSAAAAPKTDVEAPGIAAPADSTDSSGVVVAAETPVAPDVVSTAPTAPDADEGLSISTDPAQPAAPSVPEDASPFPKADEETDGQPELPEAPAEEETAALRPSVGTPAKSMVDREDDAASTRLPSVGQEGDAAAEDTRPITVFANPVEVEEGKPLMSIVLIDDGVSSLGSEALEAFPYPLTFAVNASAANAQEVSQAYRARGFEVVAMGGLPANATPGDAEVAMSAYIANVPEAVAIMETPDAGLQQSRSIARQITTIVKESGHGLVLFPKGLNTARALAVKDGVPAANVFRDFDSKDQSPTVIRRFLDQAAFKASTEGAVIMVGRLRADTISALLLWGLQDRVERVALVPVSQILTASQQ